MCVCIGTNADVDAYAYSMYVCAPEHTTNQMYISPIYHPMLSSYFSSFDNLHRFIFIYTVLNLKNEVQYK